MKMFKKLFHKKDNKLYKVTVLNLHTEQEETVEMRGLNLTGYAISGCYDLISVEVIAE